MLDLKRKEKMIEKIESGDRLIYELLMECTDHEMVSVAVTGRVVRRGRVSCVTGASN